MNPHRGLLHHLNIVVSELSRSAPFYGAVLAKIFVLVLIVLFIQKRPQGLFALKGRSAEA